MMSMIDAIFDADFLLTLLDMELKFTKSQNPRPDSLLTIINGACELNHVNKVVYFFCLIIYLKKNVLIRYDWTHLELRENNTKI